MRRSYGIFRSSRATLTGLLALLAAFCVAGTAGASAYHQTNLVSDLPNTAAFQDSNLVNPWGIAYSPTGPFWISDNGSGLSTVYNGQGQPSPLVVSVPPPSGGNPPSAPTGELYNPTKGFAVGTGQPALFILVDRRWNDLRLEQERQSHPGNPRGGQLRLRHGLQRAGDGDAKRNHANLRDRLP